MLIKCRARLAARGRAEMQIASAARREHPPQCFPLFFSLSSTFAGIIPAGRDSMDLGRRSPSTRSVGSLFRVYSDANGPAAAEERGESNDLSPRVISLGKSVQFGLIQALSLRAPSRPTDFYDPAARVEMCVCVCCR